MTVKSDQVLQTKVKSLEAELEETYRSVTELTNELEGEKEALKAAQQDLIQSEKRASLGQLVAGVAHEINNPNNFVCLSAQGLVTKLHKFKMLILELVGNDAENEEMRKTFTEQFNSFSEYLSDIREGSARILTIVDDLQTFSRQDEHVKHSVNIIDGLTSTLRLIKTQYGEQIDFFCDFQTNPEIECYPNQLNQVFMNIMTNACQAIIFDNKQINAQKKGTLKIRTFPHNDQMAICFHDSGCGMTDEVKHKVFDPFFTTKPVGQGTGLGMSISLGIVEKHQGKIAIESIYREGTMVTVYLPIDLPPEKGSNALKDI